MEFFMQFLLLLEKLAGACLLIAASAYLFLFVLHAIRKFDFYAYRRRSFPMMLKAAATAFDINEPGLEASRVVLLEISKIAQHNLPPDFIALRRKVMALDGYPYFSKGSKGGLFASSEDIAAMRARGIIK